MKVSPASGSVVLNAPTVVPDGWFSASALGDRASAVGEAYVREHWVYKRSGRPCRKCGTRIESRRQGEQARTAYWCPACQPG